MIKRLAKLLKDTDTVERCGLILKGNKIIETENLAENPELGFEIPAAQMIEHEDELIGTWHTHPNFISLLSEQDYFGFLMWPSLKHYIIGTDGVRCYIVENGIVLNVD